MKYKQLLKFILGVFFFILTIDCLLSTRNSIADDHTIKVLKKDVDENKAFFQKKQSKHLLLSSIKPIQLIVTAIAGQKHISEVLLNPGASPHAYHLKPSDIKKLHDADVIIWLGPELEAFLEKALATTTQEKTEIVSLFKDNRIKLKHWNTHTHYIYDEEHADNTHSYGNFDPHIWLDPNNALAIGHIIKDVLTRKFSENKQYYLNNWHSFQNKVLRTDEDNKKILNQISGKQFFVYHDAWGYFTEHYHLNVAGIFSHNPENQLGAKHLSQLYDSIKSTTDRCILTEPQFQPKKLSLAIKKYKLKSFMIDPMAGQFDAKDQNAYVNFLSNTANTVYRCVKNAS